MADSPTKQLAKLLEEAGAIPVIDGIPCDEHTRRAYWIGYRQALEDAEKVAENHRELWMAPNPGGPIPLCAFACKGLRDAIRALPVPEEKR